MGRIHAAVAVALAVVVVGLAAGGSAQAASVVVQQREPGEWLTAQRYDAPATGPQTLTLVSPKQHGDGSAVSGWTTITTLDFDRDGRVDAFVNLAYSPGQGDVVYQVRGVAPAATTGTGASTCFAPTFSGASATSTPGPSDAGHTPLNVRAGTRMVSIPIDFSALPGVGGLARYQPIMTTIWTAGAGTVVTDVRPVDGWLPSAAGPPSGDGSVCDAFVDGVFVSGYRLDPAQGSDRGQGPVTRGQRMPDRTDDAINGDPDLVEAGIDQYTAVDQVVDVTADAPAQSFATVHPADLVLTFASAGGLSSATYLSSSSSNTPDALVTTSGSAGADHVTVRVDTGLSGLSNLRCYPRDGGAIKPGGGAWGTSSVGSITLPVAKDPGNHTVTVRIALDRALGIHADGGATDHVNFAYTATTMPIAGDVDYAPDVAGTSGGVQYGKCDYSGSGDGTQVDPYRMVKLTANAFQASLVATPAHPQRGESVRLRAETVNGGGQGFTYQFDPDGDGIFDGPDTDFQRDHTYTAATQATLVVWANDGTYAVAKLDVAPADPPPQVIIVADHAGPYPLGPAGATVTWSDHSTDDSAIDPSSRRWTLTRGATVIDGGRDPDFAHTFHGGDDGHWTLSLTIADDEHVSSTLIEDVEVLPGSGDSGQATAAAIARISPAGKVYAKRSVLFSAASSTVRIGPVHFAWDLDGNGSFETDTGEQATVATTYAGAGHRDVRVRLTDGYGTVSTSAPLAVDVGAAVDRAPIVSLSAP
ncbi:MAG TPA: PKD domain-containing protein, partial [Baekduia sp.]|nr:PKD domain-containing protein [Baekduia sp.]